jgi:O-antigen/teichoic acid export membrane protein
LANLISALRMLLLPVMVVNILGAEPNAYFYVAWMIANLLFTIPTAVSQSLFAEGSHSYDALRENLMKSLRFTFLLMIPAVVVLVALGKWLLLAFGQSYSLNGLRLLQALSLSSLPLAISHIYGAILRVTGRLKELIAVQAFTSAVALVGSYLLISTEGIMAVGHVWIGVHAIVAIYAGSVLMSRRF